MEMISARRSDAALVVTPHPLTCQDQRVLDAEAAGFCEGETLANLLTRHGVLVGQQWRVAIDGVDVPEQHWARVRPKLGHVVEARRVMHKDVLRIVAFAALSYFTFGAGGMAAAGGGSFLGLTGAAGWIAAGAAFMAGSMVLNRMLAPKQVGRAESSVSPTYSLTGGRNRIRAYEPIALVLGEPYAVPDLAAQPYTYFANGEQFLWQMFHLGINCSEATALRIGQTEIGLYQGVTLLRSGLATGNSPLPALGTSVDSVAGALLVGGVTNVRTSSPSTVRLAIDLESQLFKVTKDGAFDTLNVHLYAHYRPLGTTSWLPFTAYTPGVPAVTQTISNSDDSGQTFTYEHVLVPAVAEVPAGVLKLSHASQKPLRTTVELAVPAGQYEVMLSKIEADYAGSQGSNAVQWVQLKSYQEDSADYSGQARLAVNIQASGQLNGALDELNVQLRAKPMPCWNGNAWVNAVDRASGLCNPGAQILLIARGIYNENGRRLAGLGFSDDRIDIEGLKRFMVHCTANGFHFDLFLQEASSIEELLEAIAYAGMGEVAWPDGKLGVSFYTADDPLEGVINMATIKPGTFKVGYATMPMADEIELEYFDRERGNTWQPVRVRMPGVEVPQRPSSTRLTGITGQAHAATLARFAWAQNFYQRKTVSCEQDLEYLTHRKGSVVALSHDMTQWGYGGRLTGFQDAGGVITLTLDERAPGENPVGGAGSRFIGLRLPGEQQMRVFSVLAFGGESRTVTLSSPWPAGVPQPGGTPGNPVHDTLWIYDFKAVPGERLRLISVQPSAYSARQVLVPHTAEFWNFVRSGEYLPPPNNSLLNTKPEVVRVLVNEQLTRQGNTFFTVLTLSFDVRGPFARAELWGATGAGDVAPVMRLLGGGRGQSLEWQGGLDDRWHLELRVYGEVRAAEPYRLIYDVRGLREPPPNVEAISVSGDTLSWPGVEAIDLAGYLVRFQYGNNPWWNTATPLHEGVITESPYPLSRRPQGLVTLLIKAVDTTGNESAEATWIVYNFPEVQVDNVLLNFPQHPAFEGVYSGGSVIAGELRATAVDRFWEPANAPFWTPSSKPFWRTSQYGELVYEFEVFPEHEGTLVLQYDIEGEGLLVEYQVVGTEPFWEPADAPFWEPAESLFWGTPTAWSVWPGSLAFDGHGRIRFRLTVAPGIAQGVIRELTAVLDVPDVVETLENVAIAVGGTRLPLTQTYNAIRSVGLTLHGGGAGISVRLLDKNHTLGPLVEVLNGTGVSVAGVIDAETKGY